MSSASKSKISSCTNLIKIELEGEGHEDNTQMVELILRRAQLSKVTTAFRSRLALASFKVQRGWQSVKLDVIESHLEQEAQKRSAAINHGQMNMNTGEMGPPPPTINQQFGMKRKSEMMLEMDSLGRQEMLGRGFEIGDLDSNRAFGGQAEPTPSPYRQNSYTSATGAPSWEPPFQHQPVASTSSLPMNSPYASPHHTPVQQPLQNHQSSLHSNSQIFQQSNLAQSRQNCFPSSPQKPTPHFLMGHSSPPRKHASPRRPINRPMSLQKESSVATPSTFNSASPALSARQRKMQQTNLGVGQPQQHTQQPLSSSDPTFSSFVNAANALTGLSHHRTPSGATIFDPPPTNGLPQPSPFRSNQENQPILSPSHFMSPSSTNHGRPVTPPSGRLMASGSMQAGPPNTSAAELMLFLAASPSPVQTRKRDISGTNLGLLESGNFGEIEGSIAVGEEIMRGRRLFSGLDEFSSSSEIFSNSHVGVTTTVGGLEPSKSITSTGLLGPTTPSRERDRNENRNGGSDWGNFLITSPEMKVGRTLSDAY